MLQLLLLASNWLIASISINFRSAEAVRVTTDRSGSTGSAQLHENPIGRPRIRRLRAQPVDAPEPLRRALCSTRHVNIPIDTKDYCAYPYAHCKYLHANKDRRDRRI